MAVLGAEGFISLPSHCAALMAGSFAIVFALNLARDLLPGKVREMDTITHGCGFDFLPRCLVGCQYVIRWTYCTGLAVDRLKRLELIIVQCLALY
jgi:hypothetical protein